MESTIFQQDLSCETRQVLPYKTVRNDRKKV